MTKAYEALVEFRTKLSGVLAVMNQPGRLPLYRMRLKQLVAEYRWLQKIVSNRNEALQLTGIDTWPVGGRLFFHFQAIRDIAGEGSEHFSEDLSALHETHIEGFRDYMTEWLGESSFEQANSRLEDYGYGFASEYQHRMYSADDLFTCERYGSTHHNDDAFGVVTSIGRDGYAQNEEKWCDAAVSDHAFYCEISDQYYPEESFTQRFGNTGSSVCDEYMAIRADRHGYTWSERRDIWVDDDAWERGYHDWEEDEDDDEDAGRTSQYMFGYHSAPKHCFSSRLSLAQRSLRSFYGFELEMHFDDFDGRETFMRDVRNEGFADDLVTFERDGSLNDDKNGTYSVEVITAPLSLGEVQDANGALARILELAEDNNAYVSALCGAHITTNTHRMVHEHRKQFLYAFYALKPLSVFVASRENDNYASYNKRFEKYAVVNERTTDLYEFRAFAGTTSHEQAASYAEYLEALADWTRDTSLPLFTPSRTDANTRAAFRVFVRSRSTQYPHLAARFCAPAPQLKETA